MARSGWFVRSHITDGIDNVRAQLCAFWKERNLIFPDSQSMANICTAVYCYISIEKKIETTVLWIDCGIPYIDATADVCRMISPEVAADYSLLWNSSFVLDKNYQELHEEFRYSMALTQKEFITTRYNFEVQGISFNPYLDCPTREVVTPEGSVLKQDESTATLLLKMAVIRGVNGGERQLF